MYNILPTFLLISIPFLFLANNSLILLWCLLEMSSIMFICMALSEEEMKKKESFLIYFLVQSFASAFLLVYLFSWTLLSKVIMLENAGNNNFILTILLALKIAMAPLHFWLVKMSKFISWFIMMILLTWQKLIPLSFLSSFAMNPFMSMMCIISLMVGTLSQLKLTSLKMLIAYSSISHLGWMAFPLMKWSLMTLMYLCIYSLIMFPLIAMFSFSNSKYLFSQLNYKMVMLMCLLVLSLSGIPPLMGFILKWMCLSIMISSIMNMMVFSLMACLGFYIYTQMAYKSLLMAPFPISQNIPYSGMKWVWSFNLFLPILPLLY